MKLNRPTRTVVELAPEPQEERVTFNATPRVEAPSGQDEFVEVDFVEVDGPEAIPPLVQTRGPGEVPPLEPVRRAMKRIELPAPQSAIGGYPEPVDERPEFSDWDAGEPADLDVQEQEAIQQELRSEQADSHPQLQRVSRRHVVQLDQPDNGAAGSSDVGDEVTGVDDTLVVEEFPPLQRVVRESEAVPALQLIRDGSAIEGEIPQLTSYNKMDVAHLLIGKAYDSEEVILLSSYSERTIRSFKNAEFKENLFRKVHSHVNRMVTNCYEDFRERNTCRNLIEVVLTDPQKARGAEYAFAFVDDGRPTSEDSVRISDHFGESDYTPDDFEEVAKGMGFSCEPSYVFTWALVKVKIGQDFSDMPLADLMPTL